MIDPRQQAAETLQDILEKHCFFSEIKNISSPAEQQNTAFLNMLVLTALRRLVFLQKVISAFAAKKLPAKHAFARYALILASAEILFLDGLAMGGLVYNGDQKTVDKETSGGLGQDGNGIVAEEGNGHAEPGAGAEDFPDGSHGQHGQSKADAHADTVQSRGANAVFTGKHFCTAQNNTVDDDQW